jgi:predicted MarR family transcription regulator
VRVVKARVLEVQAALVASANPVGVDTLERLLHEMRDEHRRPTASLILAVFEGDVDAAEYNLKRAMDDDPPWVVRKINREKWQGGFPEMLVLHLIEIRAAQKKAEKVESCPA